MTSRLAAGAAAGLAAGVLSLYVAVLRDQGDSPPPWVLALFAVGVLGAVVAALRPGSSAAGVALVALGVLALVSLLSLGVLLLPSVVLLVVAHARRPGQRPGLP